MTANISTLERLSTWLFRLILLFVLILGAFAVAQPGRAALPSIQKVFDQHSAIMMLIDPANGQIIDANPAASRFYGYSQAQLQEMTIQQINTLTAEEVAAERKRAAAQNRSFFVFRHKLSNGEVRTVEVSSVPFVFDDHRLLFSIVTDISELRETQDALWHYQSQLEEMVDRQTEALRKGDERLITLLLMGSLMLMFAVLILVRLLIRRRQAEAALELEQKRLQEIIRGTNVGTWEWTVNTGEVTLNERWAELLGYRLDELEPICIETRLGMIHPEDRERSDRLISRLFHGELNHYECEIRLRHKNGHWVWVMERGNVVEWSEEDRPLRMSGTHQDISARKAADERIHYQAKYDTLTGLPNRTLFLDRCSLALASARRFNGHLALLFVDLDKFKPINDTLGHDAGDQVLRQIAQRLNDSIREEDTVARFGGDEFVVLLAAAHSRDDIAHTAQRIVSSLTRPCVLEQGTEVVVAASVGVSVFPEHGSTVESLLRNADVAMYEAKRREGNTYVFAEPEFEENERRQVAEV